MPPAVAVGTGYLTEPLSPYAGNVGSQATPLDLDDVTIQEMVIDSLSCATTRGHLLGLRNADARKAMDHILKMLDDPSMTTSKGLPHHPHSLRRLLLDVSRSSNTFPASTLCQASYVDRNAIAFGGYADIFKARLDERIVALKRLRIFKHSNTRNAQTTYATLRKEALLWHTLGHRFILPFLGIDQTNFEPYYCMVSDWMQNGNINDCIYHLLSTGGVVPFARWLFEISMGLRYLHSQTVVHGDLRGANIVIDDNLRVQLTDFGLSQFADASSASFGSDIGAARWLAPELFQKPRSTYASDVYSFGCVWLEIYSHRPPFSNYRHDHQVIAKILGGELPEWPSVNPDYESQVNLDDWTLIKSCWHKNPARRPDLATLVRLCAKLASCSIDPQDELILTQDLAERGTVHTIPYSPTSANRSPSMVSEHSRDEDTFSTPYDLGNKSRVLSSSSISTDVSWLMPNWPFVTDVSVGDALYMPISLLERDSWLTLSTSSSRSRAVYDTSSISSFGSLGSEFWLSSIPPSPTQYL